MADMMFLVWNSSITSVKISINLTNTVFLQQQQTGLHRTCNSNTSPPLPADATSDTASLTWSNIQPCSAASGLDLDLFWTASLAAAPGQLYQAIVTAYDNAGNHIPAAAGYNNPMKIDSQIAPAGSPPFDYGFVSIALH